MTSINHTSILDLFSTIRDGKGFYEHAAKKVDNAELKSLFTRLANAKSEFLQELPNEIRPVSDAKPAVVGSVAAEFGKLYAEIGQLLGEKSLTWVARLADSEGNLMKMSENIIADANAPAPVRSTLARFLPEVRSCYERMLKIASLKKAA